MPINSYHQNNNSATNFNPLILIDIFLARPVRKQRQDLKRIWKRMGVSQWKMLFI
jgi:hypothetical protein